MESKKKNRNEKVTETYDKLVKGVNDIFTSGKYADFIKFYSKFHKYSFENAILIYLQKPDSTYVAGYTAWQKLKRNVKKGEKGIAIFAPLIKKEIKITEDGNGDEKSKLFGFKIVYVFDVSQTEGEELPELCQELKEEIVPENLYEKLIMISPVPVRVDKIIGSAKGYFNIERKEIVLSKKINGTQKIETLVHEIAHAYVEKDFIKNEDDRSRAEVIAEGTAYTVLNTLGIETKEYSFGYIAGWAEDPKKVLKYGKTIIQASNFIIEKLEKISNDTDKLEKIA